MHDPDYCRVRYVRYADDWVISVTGSKELALSIKERARAFLADTLRLEMSEEKTFVTHAKTSHANFLGFSIYIGASVKRRMVHAEGRRRAIKRVTGWQLRVDAPVHGLVKRLAVSGYCGTVRGREHFPQSKKSLVALEDHEIVMRYNALWRGLYNYYCIFNNAQKLSWVMYILQYSCLMTISHKHRRRVPKTIQKLGVFPKVHYRIASGEVREVQFWKPPVWRQPQRLSPRPLNLDVLLARTGRLTRSHLNSPCAICNVVGMTEMHHVRALRKGNLAITRGFNKIMSAINRKQVPLCETCHDAVHAGKYDGLKLSDLAYVPQ